MILILISIMSPKHLTVMLVNFLTMITNLGTLNKFTIKLTKTLQNLTSTSLLKTVNQSYMVFKLSSYSSMFPT